MENNDQNKGPYDLLHQDVLEIKRTLKRVESILNSKTDTDPDRWLSLKELVEYLPQKPAKSTVYAWVSNNKIPFKKKGIGNKKLYFLKSEIDQFLLNGNLLKNR